MNREMIQNEPLTSGSAGDCDSGEGFDDHNLPFSHSKSMASRHSADDSGEPTCAELLVIEVVDPVDKLCALQDLVFAVDSLPRIVTTQEKSIGEKLSQLTDAQESGGIKHLQREIAQLTQQIRLVERIQNFAKLNTFST
jgi:hypothetical protein